MKLKWNGLKKKQKEKPKRFLQNIHQQFFQRMHDLDYLQWMQRNSGRYIGSIFLFAVLLSISVYMLQVEPDWPAVVSNVEMAKDDAKNQPLLSNTIIKPGLSDTVSDDASNNFLPSSTSDEGDTTNNDTQFEAKIEKQSKFEYFNPLHLPGYQAPSGGMLLYNYGLGYDPVYEDYRYHNEICYGAEHGAVMACVDGMIAEVQMNQHWQLSIRTQHGIVRYSGLDTCEKAVGSMVVAGEQIGTAKEKLYIQVVKE